MPRKPYILITALVTLATSSIGILAEAEVIYRGTPHAIGSIKPPVDELHGPISLKTAGPLAFTVGQAVSLTLEGGGVEGFRYRIAPSIEGLLIDETSGSVYGTPTVASGREVRFSVEAINARQEVVASTSPVTGTMRDPIVIASSPRNLTLSPGSSLPSDLTFEATGGAPDLQWSLVSAPSWLSIEGQADRKARLVSEAAILELGTFRVEARAVDSEGRASDTARFDIEVRKPALAKLANPDAEGGGKLFASSSVSIASSPIFPPSNRYVFASGTSSSFTVELPEGFTSGDPVPLELSFESGGHWNSNNGFPFVTASLYFPGSTASNVTIPGPHQESNTRSFKMERTDFATTIPSGTTSILFRFAGTSTSHSPIHFDNFRLKIGDEILGAEGGIESGLVHSSPPSTGNSAWSFLTSNTPLVATLDTYSPTGRLSYRGTNNTAAQSIAIPRKSTPSSGKVFFKARGSSSSSSRFDVESNTNWLGRLERLAGSTNSFTQYELPFTVPAERSMIRLMFTGSSHHFTDIRVVLDGVEYGD